MPPQQHVYGLVTNKSETVGDILQSQKLEGVNGFLNSLNESKYASFKKEPLAKGFTRNYNLPPECSS